MTRPGVSIVNQLRKLAEESCHPKYHHAALLVDKKGNVVVTGRNFGDLPDSFESRKYRHAETNALGKIPRHIKRNDLTLITARFRKDGTLGNGKPCRSCWWAIKYSGIGGYIYYDGNDWVARSF